MANTFNKRALQKKRAQKKQDKMNRREERKSNNDKGKSLDEMMVYIDEFGNFTDIPPEEQKREKVKAADIQLGAAPNMEDIESTGVLSLFFIDKSYGFITEDQSKESIFVHSNNFTEPLKESDRVSFEKELTPKGYAAINVKKIN